MDIESRQPHGHPDCTGLELVTYETGQLDRARRTAIAIHSDFKSFPVAVRQRLGVSGGKDQISRGCSLTYCLGPATEFFTAEKVVNRLSSQTFTSGWCGSELEIISGAFLHGVKQPCAFTGLA